MIELSYADIFLFIAISLTTIIGFYLLGKYDERKEAKSNGNYESNS